MSVSQRGRRWSWTRSFRWFSFCCFDRVV